MSGSNFTPGPPAGGMSVNPDAKTTNWGIAAVSNVGASAAIIGASLGRFLLINMDTMWWNVYFFIAAGLSFGADVAVTFSNPGPPTTFTTSTPLGFSDFNSFGSMKGVEFTPVIGGSLCFINIWSVDHAPNPISVGGLQIGVSGGFNWTPGRFRVSTSWGNRGGPSQVQDVASIDLSDMSTSDLDSSLAQEMQTGTDPNWIGVMT